MMSRLDEIKFEKKAEQEMKGHRGLKNGRDYRWNIFRYITKDEFDKFRSNFDKVFPNAPGAGY